MLVQFGTSTPMPTPTITVDPVSVTPGFPGFIAIVVVVIIALLLIWDMNRRVRRVRYRGELRDELDAELEAELKADLDARTDPSEKDDDKR